MEKDKILYEFWYVADTKKIDKGYFRVINAGFSNNYGYAVVKERAEQTARQSGANLVQITQIKKPNMGSSCYRIKAKMYRIEDETQFAVLVV